MTEVSHFKSDFLCKKSTRKNENTTEKLLHQMEKEITFLYEELKIKNIVITLSLENVKDNHNNENRSIHSNNDVKITQSEKEKRWNNAVN